MSTFPPSQVGEEKTKQASGGGFIDFGLITMSGDQFSSARFRPPTRCLAFFFCIFQFEQYLLENHQFTDIKVQK